MEKFMITGFSGFVSKHFIEYLETLKTNVSVLGIDVNQPDFDINIYKYVSCSFRNINLLNKNQVDNVIYEFQPDYILHLASFSSVAFSWKNPVASFSNNTNIFLNLLEQIREINLPCRVLSIGSSEEYGNVTIKDVPLTEEQILKPVSPYAVARVSQELLSKVYVDSYGLDIIITRSFNHIGPGQRDIFVISSFAKKIIDIKKNNKYPEIITGDLTIVRDFLDVRDVVKAYYILLKFGRKGEIYNVCSGVGTSLKTIIDQMMLFSGITIPTKTDPSLIRPSDNSIIVGNNKKIKTETNWENSYSLSTSLTDILNYWSKVL